MSVVAFDTLKFAQTLRVKAKLTSEQAEGISEAFADAVSEQIATKADFINLATKQDIADLDKKISGMKNEISGLKSDTKNEVSGLKSDMKNEISSLKSDMKNEISSLKSDTKDEISSLKSDTKDEISGLKSDMKDEISGLKKDISDIHRLIAETNTKIAESKAETIKWVVGLAIAQMAAIVAIFRLMPGGH